MTTTPAGKGLVARYEERTAKGWRAFATKKLDSAGTASVKQRQGKLRVVLAHGKATLAISGTVRL